MIEGYALIQLYSDFFSDLTGQLKYANSRVLLEPRSTD